MTYQFPPDVEKLAHDHMASGGHDSEDEVRRNALQALGEFVHSREDSHVLYGKTVAGVGDGAGAADTGRLRPLLELLEAARRRAKIPFFMFEYIPRVRWRRCPTEA